MARETSQETYLEHLKNRVERIGLIALPTGASQIREEADDCVNHSTNSVSNS